MTVHKQQNIDTIAQYIWENFQAYRMMEHVVRSGFGMWGIYEYNPQEKILNRPESVLEHTASVMEIFSEMERYFRHIFHPERYVGLNRKAHLYLKVLQYHDVPEIVMGDIPDDGARSEEDKNAREMALFQIMVKNWPKAERDEFLEACKAFQNPFNPELDENTRIFAENLYLCDKLDAVLKALIFEKAGFSGNLFCKINPSHRDLELSRFTRSTKVADTWAAAFVIKCKKCKNFDIFYAVLKAAVIDVRGEEFPWIDKALSE